MPSADRTNEERRAAGLDTLGRMTGSPDPATNAAQMEAAQGALGSYILDVVMSDWWPDESAISRRDRSLSTIAVLTAINLSGLMPLHVRAGLNHGLTREEMAEAVLHMAGYAGFPRAAKAMTALVRILGEIDGSPASAPLPAIPPAEAKTDAQRRADGTRIMAILSGRDPDEATAAGNLTRSLGSVGTHAVDFAFGEIWSRPGLGLRDRSLIVVSALIAMGRPEELRFHYPAALRNGLSYEELEALTGWVSVLAGLPVSVEAMRVLTPLRDGAQT